MKPIISLSLNLLKYSQTMSYNPYSLEGKTIFVTGASSGIGQSTAIECSKLGARLIITGRNIERLQQTFDRLEGEGHMRIAGDLTKSEDLVSIVEKLPQLSGFVNNVGLANTLPIQFTTNDVLNKVFETNLISPILLTSILLKKKKIAKGASLVLTSSVASIRHAYGNSVYGVSKSGIDCFSKYIAKEFATKQIRCNTVLPGMIETPLISHLDNFTEAQLEENTKCYPLKRFGKPEEVAWAIIYLLSDASSWVTGHSLVIDGGLTMK